MFDKALQFWEPTISKRKRTKSERQQDEDDEAAVPSEDFHPEDDSQEQAECDRASVDAYMNVLSRRSPEMAQRESLLHAAETSHSDDAFMAKALGSDAVQSTPTANLATGLTKMLEEFELSTEKPPPKPKADGPVVIELGDSPPEPPKKAPRLHADFSHGLPTGAAARLQMLKLLGWLGEACMHGYSVLSHGAIAEARNRATPGHSSVCPSFERASFEHGCSGHMPDRHVTGCTESYETIRSS